MKELTSKGYWEKYYDSSSIKREDIIRICGHYDAFWDQMVAACKHPPRSIIEIGAYPGRYIAYLAAQYGLAATSLDYNSDRTKIEEAFKVMGVESYEIIQADFLQFEPDKKYDLVISNGFIEHFENFDEVLDRHSRYLAPGGAMLIMIPNKRFLRKWYGMMVDRNNLRAHNLKCMNVNTFVSFANRNLLSIKYLKYYGGFPYSVHQELNLFQKVIFRIFRFVFRRINVYLAKHPSKYYSSAIICILT